MGRKAPSELPLASDRLEEQTEIAHQAPQRIFERRRPVLLEEEMPDPGEAVADQRHGQQPPGVARRHKRHEGRDHQPRPDHMDAAARPVGMLMNIIGVKGLERGVPPLGLLDAHGPSLPPDRAGGKRAPSPGHPGSGAAAIRHRSEYGHQPLRRSPAYASPERLRPGWRKRPRVFKPACPSAPWRKAWRPP